MKQLKLLRLNEKGFNTTGAAAILVVIILVVGLAFTLVNQNRNAANNTANTPAAGSQNPSGGQNQGATGPANTDGNFSAKDLDSPSGSEAAENEKSSLTLTMNSFNNSGETGKVEFYDLGNNKTEVEITLTGQPAGISQPAHIHIGSCPGVGAVKYPLNPVENGKSETVVNVSLSQILSEVPLAVNVHKSASELGTYVSCADIKGK